MEKEITSLEERRYRRITTYDIADQLWQNIHADRRAVTLSAALALRFMLWRVGKVDVGSLDTADMNRDPTLRNMRQAVCGELLIMKRGLEVQIFRLQKGGWYDRILAAWLRSTALVVFADWLERVRKAFQMMIDAELARKP